MFAMMDGLQKFHEEGGRQQDPLRRYQLGKHERRARCSSCRICRRSTRTQVETVGAASFSYRPVCSVCPCGNGGKYYPFA